MTHKTEQWKLLTSKQRSEFLATISNTVAQLTDNKEATQNAITHVLAQSLHLDETRFLTGATGETNELYNQARGNTVVLGPQSSDKNAFVILVFASLVAGNPVTLCNIADADFAKQVAEAVGTAMQKEFGYSVVEVQENIEQALEQPMLAQVAVTGTIEQIQTLSSELSKTMGMLTQVIAISDTQGMREIFNPDFMHRFVTERVRTINTTAIGGNAGLLELGVE